jgi:hypothetical protein
VNYLIDEDDETDDKRQIDLHVIRPRCGRCEEWINAVSDDKFVDGQIVLSYWLCGRCQPQVPKFDKWIFPVIIRGEFPAIRDENYVRRTLVAE